jgi:hypothetical protein
MAKVKTTGVTDTPISGVSALTFPRGLLNYAADFRVKSNNAGKEVVLTNITAPVDRPEKIRIGYSEVSNVYAGSGVEPTISAPSKRGTQILAQITEVISVTDDADPEYRLDLPVSYHLVVKVPTSQYITAADINTGLGRLLSSLFDTGVTTTSRLDAILRGALIPADL